MKFLKKTIFFASLLSLPLFADYNVTVKSTHSPSAAECYDGGFTVGVAAANSYEFSNVYLLTLGYFNDYFLFDIGGNYERNNGTISDTDLAIVKSHLGLRTRLFQNLFVSYGAVGSVVVTPLNDSFFPFTQRPYTVGAFTGLDLQIVRHWVLSVKIYPFEYAKTVGSTTYSVFQTGSVNCSYVF